MLMSPASEETNQKSCYCGNLTDACQRFSQHKKPYHMIWGRGMLKPTASIHQLGTYKYGEAQYKTHKSCPTETPIIDIAKDVLRYARKVLSSAGTLLSVNALIPRH